MPSSEAVEAVIKIAEELKRKSMIGLKSKARPIIMNAESVNLILQGIKTNTCRVIKPQPGSWEEMGMWENIYFRDNKWWLDQIVRPGKYQDVEIRCPYGKPGEFLWIRETWGAVDPTLSDTISLHDCIIEYRADLPKNCTDYPGQWPAKEARGNPDAPKWRSPIHMPRWASRLLLQIEIINALRLHDLKNGDIANEGIVSHEALSHSQWEKFLHQEFATYWDSINKKRGFSYESSPWVWSVRFKVEEVKT